MRAQEGHQLSAFQLEGAWESDAALRLVLYRLISTYPSTKTSLSPQELDSRLSTFSQIVKNQVRPISNSISEPSINPEPKLIQYDYFGKRVDKLILHQGWKDLTAFSFQHGIVGEAYPKQYQSKWLQGDSDSAGGRDRLGSLARVLSFSKNYIFAPDSHVNLCPTSMQDGLVRTLELYGNEEQKQRYLERLLSRDPNQGWTAGQWMTERAGGSDVSMTETTAERVTPLKDGEKPKGGDRYLISGFKWFSSAADGQVALALARTNPDLSLGSRGLSAFIIPIHKKNRPSLPPSVEARVKETDERKGHTHSPYNGIYIHRLKNKLGTKMVPTAELELDEAVGELIGQEGRGVALISSVLNLTRLYSATGSSAGISRSLQIATAHASVRRVGTPGVKPPGILLKDLPLHASRLARVSVTHRAILQLVWLSVILLGRSEAGDLTPTEANRLRLLTPVAKGFAASRATECYAACIEACGGQGMMSENELGTILRDGTVERIWEGTPSILSLDVARVLIQTKGKALEEFCQDQIISLDRISTNLGDEAQLLIMTLKSSIQEVEGIFKGMESLYLLKDGRASRALLDLIAIFTCGVGLLEQVEWIKTSDLSSLPKKDQDSCDSEVELEAARRWIMGAEGQLSDAMREIRELSKGTLSGTNLKDGVRSSDLEKRLVFSKL